MIGRWILKIAPWWVFLPFLFVMTPLMFVSVSGYFENERKLEDALRAPAPEVVDLKNLRLPAARESFQEVAFRGVFDGNTDRIEAGKVDYVFALLTSQDGDGPRVAVITEAYLLKSLLRNLAGAKGVDGLVSVRGFEEKAHIHRGKIVQILKGKGAWNAAPFYVVEPYWQTREQALEARSQKSVLLALIAVTVWLAILILTVVKFWRWISRLRKSQMSVRLGDGATDTGAKPAKQRLQDVQTDKVKTTESETVVRRRR